MSYLTFLQFLPPVPRKTSCWSVAARGVVIGEVRWFTRWRRYCFFPAPETVFEQDCLREISTFIEAATRTRTI